MLEQHACALEENITAASNGRCRRLRRTDSVLTAGNVAVRTAREVVEFCVERIWALDATVTTSRQRIVGAVARAEEERILVALPVEKS